MFFSTQKLQIILVILSFVIIDIAMMGCSSTVRFTSEAKKTVNEKKEKKLSEKKAAESKETTKQIPSPPINIEDLSEARAAVLQEAERWLGTPYCWGGETRQCTDCSGFTQNVFTAAGVYLPRTAQEQFDLSDRINDLDCLPGDIVFFRSGNNINHVGIYIGDGFFIHASSSLGVIKTSLSDFYYKERFAGFGAVLK